MNMKLNISENEKDQISSQHEEIDPKIFNFLIRRITVIERILGFDDNPIKVIEYRFDGFPEHGFHSFVNKKIMERKIIELLWEADMIGFDIYDQPTNKLSLEAQKIKKTIRKFLNFILENKK